MRSPASVAVLVGLGFILILLVITVASTLPPPVVDVVAVAVALVVALATTMVALSAIKHSSVEARKAVEDTLETRLARLAESTRDSSRLFKQISAELDARRETAKELKEQADDAEAIAEMNKPQTDAVRRLLDAQLEGSERRIRRDAIVIGVMSFIAGGGVTYAVTLLVHPLHGGDLRAATARLKLAGA
jgi:septal ring factor EnvC (AmiA/AmiB activator)